jgi:hypothetical protein
MLADYGLHADCARLYTCKPDFTLDVWVGHIDVNTHLGLFEFEYHAF